MQTKTSRFIRTSALAAASFIALTLTAPAFAFEADDQAAGCARQFEVAQKLDMESFRDYDAETFRAAHTDDAITVFTSGAMRIGIDAIMQTLAGHFEGREGLWSWTEKYRVVDGCRSAYILYETIYEIPRIGYRARALTGVTYTHDGSKWLSIADQGTKLP